MIRRANNLLSVRHTPPAKFEKSTRLALSIFVLSFFLRDFASSREKY
jgi:hypothetical protein